MKGQVNTDTSSKTTDLLTFSLTDVISSRVVAYYMSIGHGALVLTLKGNFTSVFLLMPVHVLDF